MQINKHISLTSFVMAIFSFVPMAVAQKGFSIEGGLVYDRPIDSDSRRAFDDLRSGFGYTGNLGYDFFDRFGLEVGVMHTRHDYDLSSSGGRVLEEVAGRTAFFLKVRGVPLRIAKSELVLEAGPGFFDINGLRQVPGGDAEASYSGWGFVSNASYRYHINEGLAVALLFGANIVKYSRFNLLGFETPVQGEYPRGNSLSWGLTVFHRIGIPQG